MAKGRVSVSKGRIPVPRAPAAPRMKTSVRPPGKLGKYAQSSTLPSRSALNKLTQGDPVQRSTGSYAKATPLGLATMGIPGIDLPATKRKLF